MPYQPYDLSDKSSRDFKAHVKKKAHSLDQIAARNVSETPRPLNHLEQNATQSLYAIGEFVDVARDALKRRGSSIPRFNARLGLMQYAARSIFADVVGTLDQESARKFSRNVTNREVKCVPKAVAPPPDHARIIWDEDAAEIHEAAWRGTCMFCEKSGKEARECKLRKAFDHTMMLNAGDNKDCWWRAD